MRLRGRIGVREALEEQPELVVLDPEPLRGKWADFFGNDRPIHVELGMGKGKFIGEMSARHPGSNFIGVDKYDELVRRASVKACKARESDDSARLGNLALVRCNVELIDAVFADAEIERIYLNFSDPWPKKRHVRRRLTHPDFIRKYMKALKAGGEIHLKTDSIRLFEYSLNVFAGMGLPMKNISLNLHGDGVREDQVMTEYEAKFVSMGMNIYRCEVVAGGRSVGAAEPELEPSQGSGPNQEPDPNQGPDPI